MTRSGRQGQELEFASVFFNCGKNAYLSPAVLTSLCRHSVAQQNSTAHSSHMIGSLRPVDDNDPASACPARETAFCSGPASRPVSHTPCEWSRAVSAAGGRVVSPSAVPPGASAPLHLAGLASFHRLTFGRRCLLSSLTLLRSLPRLHSNHHGPPLRVIIVPTGLSR